MHDPNLVAELSSSGPWYLRKVKATSILARRAVQSRQMSWGDFDSLMSAEPDMEFPIEPKEGDQRRPTPQMARIWGRKFPSLPEDAIRDGLLSVTDIPVWAAKYIRENVRPASMENESPYFRTVGVGTAKPQESNSSSALEDLVKFALIIVATRKIFGAPKPEQVRQGGRSRGGLRPLSIQD